MKEVIIACDFQDIEELNNMLKNFKETKPYLKIGMEMYYLYGRNLIERLSGDGYKVFLDLKCHDIPTTVYKAMRQLGKLNVNMVNVHSAGGIEMMKVAKQGVLETSKVKTEVIAVTQLTSTDEKMLKDEL
jgi:orotidine-5'-phosphate decarboxylase